MSRSLSTTLILLGSLLPACTARVSSQATVPLDSARLLADVAVLAHDSMEGRASGTAGNLKARVFLERALGASGAQPPAGGYARPFEWARGSGVNLVASVPGRTEPERVIVLTAHYDHVGIRDGEIYNGADDNASGVAAVLEITRRIAAEPLEHTLVVALLDAEEVGSVGARAFVAASPVPFDRVALNVNLDMVSRTDGMLWAGGTFQTPALRPVLERVASRSPVELRLGHDRPGAPEGDDWTEQSDHVAFHERGIPFVYFGVEDHADYHRPTDDVERIDPGEYFAAVRTILAALRELDGDLPPRATTR